MNQAKQALKKTTKYSLVCSVVLAAVIGLNGFSQNVVNAAESVDEVQEPKIEIQKQQVIEEIQPDSREKYIVRSGDNMYKIATKFKHERVKIKDYHAVLIKINSGHNISVNEEIMLPNNNDLRDVLQPEVEILFSIHDEDFITDLKHSEGSSTAQSRLKRRLLNGVGAPFKNNKFYPYKDSNGNYTIGYGHYIGKYSSDALKYKNGITKQQAHALLKNDMKRILDDFEVLLKEKEASHLDERQQKILFEMAFTMGVFKLHEFKKLWKHSTNDERFDREIKNSLWYRQVGNRAERMLAQS